MINLRSLWPTNRATIAGLTPASNRFEMARVAKEVRVDAPVCARDLRDRGDVAHHLVDSAPGQPLDFAAPATTGIKDVFAVGPRHVGIALEP